MSGGGKIIEKCPMRLPESGRDVIRYWVIDNYPPIHPDETCVYAEPADDEPLEGEAIWWGGGREIYWGPNDKKRLVKVGYSFSAPGTRSRRHRTQGGE